MNMLENKIFDEIQIGDQASLTRTLDREGVEALGRVTGHFNPIIVDAEPKDTSAFSQGGGQAGWSAILFTTLVGTCLPGLGSVARRIEVRLNLPVAMSTPVTARGTVREKRLESGIVVLECEAVGLTGEVIATGWVEASAPKEKMRYAASDLPKMPTR
jgi:acyl dehydratase